MCVFFQGISYLVENKLLDGGAPAIAEFLYKEEGLNKTAIGEFLGERWEEAGKRKLEFQFLICGTPSSREDLHLQTLKAFVDLHEFSDLNLVQALRSVSLIFTAAGLQPGSIRPTATNAAALGIQPGSENVLTSCPAVGQDQLTSLLRMEEIIIEEQGAPGWLGLLYSWGWRFYGAICHQFSFCCLTENRKLLSLLLPDVWQITLACEAGLSEYEGNKAAAAVLRPAEQQLFTSK